MPRQLDVQTLANKLAQGEPVFLLDVRQPWESAVATLPNSVLIPLNELPQRADEIEPSADAQVVVYCHHGIRSLSGAAYLEQHGIRDVVSLAGGIDAWSLQVDPTVPRY